MDLVGIKVVCNLKGRRGEEMMTLIMM